jgi:hypothetical protein
MIAALVALVLGAVPAAHAAPTARLVDVDVIKVAKNPAKPVGAANCSNDDPTKYTGAWNATGWVVQGAKTAHLNTSTVPGGLTNVPGAMQAAFDAWAGGAVPKITVATDGTLTREAANHRYDLLFARKGGATLAVTYTWMWSNGEIESDTVFNNQFSWITQSSEGDGCYENAGARYDVRNIGAHEFGHTYGLGHPAGARYETMYAYGYSGETLKWSPTSGEKSGLASLY